ncbi:NADH:ubiquinone oxidoreductase subunit NDUFA12 [Parvularcula sp. IMCC14364]|uniref:NADH:ubiquinone oxidoreductase subunit NDUFA12 n=1 Tax=Parvularcula sp. IMCC14364 TaxID=3067902 RepID=UPI0027403B23|nr:NADH:ubiquinone oxidoreductase subunit NDUFA12 [Parvularcula sp. IMCC14364]
MIKKLFAWWDTATLGTSWTLFRKGAKEIGQDAQGNRYFEEGGKPSFPDGRRRRWVTYHGVAEPSRVPADWHGWLHHTFDEPPTTAPLLRQKFEKEHLPNMTGTPLAYHPKGSLYHTGQGGKTGVGRDYEAWSPEDQ